MTLKEQKQQNRPEGKTLSNLSNYTITEEGKVWTKIKDRYLKGLTKPEGYKMVFLQEDNGNQRWYYIHRLVATAYIPNIENKPDVDHIDNNPSNNHYTNLQWVTHQENLQFSFTRDNRQSPKGKDHWNYGKKGQHSPETKQKMSEKKMGELHPKFKGYYYYQGTRYTSLNQLARDLSTNPNKVKRMVQKGLILFEHKLAA